MKESKVLSVGDPIINGDWHNFEIEFENGDKGVYGSFKQPSQNYFKEGEIVKYTFEDGRYPKVKPITEKKAWTGKGGGFKGEPFEHKAAGFAMSYSKDLVISGHIEIGNMSTYFEKIYKLLISKKVN
jgi:hypothetical protein